LNKVQKQKVGITKQGPEGVCESNHPEETKKKGEASILKKGGEKKAKLGLKSSWKTREGKYPGKKNIREEDSTGEGMSGKVFTG